MSFQQVTIELPEPVMRQLMRIAAATRQPIEVLVAQSVLSNLPPSTENAPPELEADLLSMQLLSVDELLVIAYAQAAPQQRDRQAQLLELNGEGRLSQADQQELTRLRAAADQLMLRKTYAWSLLRWKGYKLPALADLPVPA